MRWATVFDALPFTLTLLSFPMPDVGCKTQHSKAQTSWMHFGRGVPFFCDFIICLIVCFLRTSDKLEHHMSVRILFLWLLLCCYFSCLCDKASNRNNTRAAALFWLLVWDGVCLFWWGNSQRQEQVTRTPHIWCLCNMADLQIKLSEGASGYHKICSQISYNSVFMFSSYCFPQKEVHHFLKIHQDATS